MCNWNNTLFSIKKTKQQKTEIKANGPQRVTSSIDYPWRGQCGGKIQGQSTCSADDDDGFKDICTHSPLQLHLGSIFLSA